MNKWILVLFAAPLIGCGSGPEAEGKALAKEFCDAMEASASDPAKAMALGMEFGNKATAAGQKYASDPAKLQELLKGYQEGAQACQK
jgi:hypothetical protein